MDMELTSRIVYLMRNILSSDEGIPIATLLEQLNVTKRTLYYELEHINGWLESKKLGKVRVVNHEAVLFTQSKSILRFELDKCQSYYFSIEERKAMEIILIALSSQPITLESMRLFFDVSKNTILFDIRELKKDLLIQNVMLMNKSKTGYFFEGAEASIRRMIGEELQKLTNSRARRIIRSIMQKSLETITENNIDFHEIARCLTKQYEKDIEGEIFLRDTEYVNLLILVSWIRSGKGNVFNMSSVEKFALSNSASYRSVDLSIQKLKIHNLNIPPMELFFITPLFLGIHTSHFVPVEKEDTFISEFTYELLRNFERLSCISFVDKERLKSQLVYHIRPLYFRLKYGIKSVNPLLDDIKRMYPIIFEFTKCAIDETDSEISKMIKEDEIGYICIHFASHLNEKRIIRAQAASKDRILIVGESSMATSILVEDQIRRLLGNSFIYERVSTSKIRDWMLDDYILIISTAYNSYQFACNHLLTTGPILSDISKKKIFQIINKREMFYDSENKIGDILAVVSPYVKDELAKISLYFDLFKLMNKEESIEDSLLPDGIDMKVKKGDIVQMKSGCSWEAVLHQGCASLVGEENGSRLYDRMVNLLLKNGNKTYQIIDDVLLIHCPMQGKAEMNVNLAVIVAGDTIVFPGGESASVIIFISTKDNYAHWQVLDETYKYFKTKKRLLGIKELYGEHSNPEISIMEGK